MYDCDVGFLLKQIYRLMMVEKYSWYRKTTEMFLKGAGGRICVVVWWGPELVGSGRDWVEAAWALYTEIQNSQRTETVNSERTFAELGHEYGESRIYSRVDHEPQTHPWANKMS